MDSIAGRTIGLGSLGALGTRAVSAALAGRAGPQDLPGAALAQSHLPGVRLLSVGFPQMPPNGLAGGEQTTSKREAISWNPQGSGLESTEL